MRLAGLVASQHMELSRTRDWSVLCIDRWVLNHWITREVLCAFTRIQRHVYYKGWILLLLFKLLTRVQLFCDPHGLQPARLLCPWHSPSKNTGVGCLFLLQGVFLIQGLNPCLLHWQESFFFFPLTAEPPGKPSLNFTGCKLHRRFFFFFNRLSHFPTSPPQ